MWQTSFFYFCNNEQRRMPFYPALLHLDGRRKCLPRLQICSFRLYVLNTYHDLACYFSTYACTGLCVQKDIIVQGVMPNLGHMFSISHSQNAENRDTHRSWWLESWENVPRREMSDIHSFEVLKKIKRRYDFSVKKTTLFL